MSVLFKEPQRNTILRLVHRTVGTMTLESRPSAGPGPEGQQHAQQKARQKARPKIMCHDQKYFVVRTNTRIALRNDPFYFSSAFCRTQFVDFCRRPPNDVSRCLSAFLLAQICRKPNMWPPSPSMHLQMTSIQIESRRVRSDHLSRQYCGRRVWDYVNSFHVFFVGRLRLSPRRWGH